MKTWLIALGITIIQLATALSLCKTMNLSVAYKRLCQWDSEWYCDIVERGYASYVPAPPLGSPKDNGGFFPAYPLSARFLRTVFALDPQFALLFVAQGAAIVFWFGFLSLLKRWHVRPPYQTLAVLALLAHPCSFYLIAGYTESLFCAAVVLFIYFSQDRSPRATFGTMASGFVMTATRITGFPLAGLPLCCWKLRERPTLIKAILYGIVSSLGGFVFFFYCKFHFGDFMHYLKIQKEGWGLIPDYFAIFKKENYVLVGNRDQLTMVMIAVALWLSMLLEIGVSAWTVQRSPGWSRGRLWKIRLPWYIGAFAVWYLSASGVAAVSFRSLIRYSLPCALFLIIAWTHLFSFSIRLPKLVKATLFAILTILLGIAISIGTLALLNSYLHGRWVS